MWDATGGRPSGVSTGLYFHLVEKFSQIVFGRTNARRIHWGMKCY
jgi:hypothetical protein